MRAAQEIDTLEFTLRYSYEKLDKAINSETQRRSLWTHVKLIVVIGSIGGCAGALFLLVAVLGLREALVVLGLR